MAKPISSSDDSEAQPAKAADPLTESSFDDSSDDDDSDSDDSQPKPASPAAVPLAKAAAVSDSSTDYESDDSSYDYESGSSSDSDSPMEKSSSSAVAKKTPASDTSKFAKPPTSGMKRPAASALALDSDEKRSKKKVALDSDDKRAKKKVALDTDEKRLKKKVEEKTEAAKSAGSKGSKSIAQKFDEAMEKDEEMKEKSINYVLDGKSVEEWLFGEGKKLLDDEARSEMEKECREMEKKEAKLFIEKLEMKRKHAKTILSAMS